jgi:hypothetical protein
VQPEGVVGSVVVVVFKTGINFKTRLTLKLPMGEASKLTPDIEGYSNNAKHHHALHEIISVASW